MCDWFLVYSKTRQEDAAASGLREQGFNVYLPKLQVRKRRSQGMVEVIQPLFPRYVFVQPKSSDQSITPVQFTAGVQKVVKFGTDYLPVSNLIIEGLKSREDPKTGFHSLVDPAFRRGERLRIISGAFGGLEGIFEAKTSHHRVIVLLDLLGHRTPTEIYIQDLDI